MANKYQFFTIPNSKRQKFTYLDMASNTFLEEKDALLAQGYEVEDDSIYADSAQEAVEKYKSNYIYALEEYNTSSNPFYSLILIYKWLKGLFVKAK
ncbi:hypothetical protein GCE9029_01225 [Grimontia celer]|uniref:Uncharacterized protein n=2 Tax=Grimontia TaxID=246861 RepID=A0A128EWU6_9GAMM|nr:MULTISPECIES: hypothetical protein [Grimontia]NGN96802.1 hypothetical protein [Grimontia sedimenti]CZF79048.1 hypothetical protein GCE9029_01225 [Grimontia celer]